VALKEFGLSSPLFLTFVWMSTPGGIVAVASGPLVEFTRHAGKYLKAVHEADFINLWTDTARSVVQRVKDSELSVDPDAYDRYKQKRPRGIPTDEILAGVHVAGFPDALAGRIDPYVAEVYVTQAAGLVTFGKSVGHAKDVVKVADQAVGRADSSIAAENPFLRQARARRWGHEHGFYSDALEKQWDDIKENIGEIATEMGKEVAFFTFLQFIPFVNVVANIHLGVQLAMQVAETIGDLEAADEAARNAKTAVALQRAAALQATALSSAARKIAEAVVMHKATKLATKGARAAGDKIVDWANKRQTTKVQPEATRAAQEPAKAQEQARQTQAEAEKQASKQAATERLPGEKTEPLSKGEARVTAEGRCKICHSPCEFHVDLARQVLLAVETPAFRDYRGYAENLS
jgi:hypothetical protein